MDATDFQMDKDEQRPSGGMHPLAAAVALALAGALAGCASQSLPPDAPEVDRAKAAFARKDYSEAARLLSEPAMKGDAGAQYALGYLYYYGQGVPQDLYRARTWLETSAQLGNRDAKRALATLKVYGKLPAAGTAKATDTAQAAKPAPAAASAAAQASEAVKEESVATMPSMAPASGTPAGAATDGAAPAPAVTVAPEVKEVPTAPVAGDAPVPAPDAPVVAAPTPASAPEARPPVAVVPAAPVSAAPAESSRPAPVAPQEDSTPADSETASGGAAAEPAPALQARTPEPAVEVAPRSAPVPVPVEPNPQVLPGEAGAVARESGAEPVARPVALERPAPAAVTLVPGSEQAQPVIRKPVPRSDRPRYTIHLLSSPSKEELLQTVRSFGLAQAAWYPVQQGNGTQYRLIFGGYDTMVEARAALRALPEALYARNPWVNNYPESVTITAFNGIPTARVAAVERNILR